MVCRAAPADGRKRLNDLIERKRALRLKAVAGLPRFVSLRGVVLLGLFAAVLTGCATAPRGGVHVVDRNSHGQVVRGDYIVQRGDSVSSIAKRFGLNWRELAQRNRIAPPYVIHPGQRLSLGGAAPQGVQMSRPAPAQAPAPARQAPATVIATPVPTPPPITREAPPPRPVDTSSKPMARSASGWSWPANGSVIGVFSSNGSLNKGIDIAGELGQPVFAASDGAVVYAGSGLRGYGELVIIKHNDTYVSAYGHNRRLLVREGQQVKAGQTIAEMGSTGTDRVKLHFEIRRQGKPVDPQQYLPKR
jgi:lipoprotein NlpD